MKKDDLKNSKSKPFVITRVFDAPREKVWQAWTKSDIMKLWWGPKNFTAPVSEMDVRKGGKYFSCMRSPEGKNYCSTGVYEEIIPMERIVVSDSFSDEKGNVVPASYYGMSKNWPQKLQAMVTFRKQNKKTKMILKYPDVSQIEMKDLKDMRQGWNQSFDKLAKIFN